MLSYTANVVPAPVSFALKMFSLRTAEMRLSKCTKSLLILNAKASWYDGNNFSFEHILTTCGAHGGFSKLHFPGNWLTSRCL